MPITCNADVAKCPKQSPNEANAASYAQDYANDDTEAPTVEGIN